MPNHNLSYPLDVEGDDQQGHYIMFMINETTPGKVGKRAKKPLTDMGQDAQWAAFKARAAAKKKRVFIDEHLNSGAGKKSSTLSSAPKAGGLAARPGTTRMAQAITLYMPPSVKVSYKSVYKNAEIGMLASGIAGTAMAAIEAKEKGRLAELAAGGKAALEGAAVAGALGAMKLADTFAPGAAALAQISAGAVVGSKMEVLFSEVDRRNFSFAFNFIPKSEQESRMVYDIVQTFKEHMLPEYLASITVFKKDFKLGQGRILKIPDTFDIFYFYKNNENPFLNRISTCYLTSMDIDYGGDKYVTYEPTTVGGRTGPPPQRTAISLAFTEIETITRERAKQGF